MLAILHYNSNIDSEANGKNIVIRKNLRVGRANGEPNARTHKTIILDWQKELISYVKQYKKKTPINKVELVDKFRNLTLEDFTILENGDQQNEDEQNYKQDLYWMNYFEDLINVE